MINVFVKANYRRFATFSPVVFLRFPVTGAFFARCLLLLVGCVPVIPLTYRLRSTVNGSTSKQTDHC